MRLIPRYKIYLYPDSQFENPFFAVSHVEQALLDPDEIFGLTELILEMGFYPSQCLEPLPKGIILEKVENAEWLLACSNPFSPYRPDSSSLRTGHMYPQRGDSSGVIARNSSRVSDHALQVAAGTGPGKWVLKSIDHDVLWNMLAITANRSGTISNEGGVIFSDGKDWANTRRTLIHEWVGLSMDEKSFELGSAIHRYGELKRTTQKYVEADDHWALKGQSWHWVPATPDKIFERRN
ncbi:hypothetical protein [Pseudomonas entomophila]|uniref:hypothetical protein n=1 Tax=Pseudomonas entomophila TaxID=312306 RepID=UPI00200EFA38|nr:hypothetical protein [Pseudomonas entomophila]